MTANGYPWWKGAVIYQVYPRSFKDCDGDGIGDLPGIIDKLGYVADLGVDAIWLSPFYRSPMKDFGYDVSDGRDVDPIFGDLADFDRLVAAAHGLGLKVIIDLVLGHVSDQHPWFEESRQSRDNAKADWFVWADPRPDGTVPNNWLSVFGGPAWQWEGRRRQYYLHHFLKAQPNLNWHHEPVVEAMLDQARFWLDRGVDGFRLDAITSIAHDPYLRDNPPRDRSIAHDAMSTDDTPFAWQDHVYDRDRPEALAIFARLRALADRYGETFLIGEIGDVDSIEVGAKYTQSGRRLHSSYNFSLTSDFDADHVRAVISRTEALLGDGWATYALGNHDVPRVASRFPDLAATPADRARLAKMLMALLLCQRGGACVYQGDELGLPQVDLAYADIVDPFGLEFWPQFKGRDGCRTPMPWQADHPQAGFTDGPAAPWLPVGTAHRPLAVDRQQADPDSVWAFTRAFLRWRKTQPAIRHGSKRILSVSDGLVGFERVSAGQGLLCLFNLSRSPATVDVAAGWRRLGRADGLPTGSERTEGKTIHPIDFAVFFK